MVFDASQTALIWTSSSDIPGCVLHHILCWGTMHTTQKFLWGEGLSTDITQKYVK